MTPTPAPSAEPAMTPGGVRDPSQAVRAEAVDGPFRLVFELADDTWRSPISSAIVKAGGYSDDCGAGRTLRAQIPVTIEP
jgi:hypothetical protein